MGRIKIALKKELNGESGKMLLDVDFELTKGQLVTIYGSSGAGKTSILRMIAGLLAPDDGIISVASDAWFDRKQGISLVPQKRKVGFVFQDYALFPHMTVRQNLEYALMKGQDGEIITQLLELVGLQDLQSRKPDTLSGGQRQRLALARALVQKPDLLLLDEPLSALDHSTRLKIQDYLLQIQKELNLTILLVSHDVGEIHRLSDKVMKLENGKIIQQGTPEEVLISDEISGKFKFVGEVLYISQEEVVHIVTVLIHNQVVKVIAQPSETQNLTVGDKVMVASKAFNPIIYKIE